MAQYYLIPKELAERFPSLQRGAMALEAHFLQSIFWLIGRLKPEQATRLAATCFGWFGPFSSKARKADTNLSIAFPDRDETWRRRTVRGIFRHLGEASAELIKLEQIWQEHETRLEFTLDPIAREHIEQKKPAVFVCAHVGAWQLVNLISRRYGLTISTVYAPESNPRMGEILNHLRQSFGVKLIPTDAGVRPLIKELQQGNSIGLASDTRLNTGELIPFFGREALTNTTPARLALRSGAALVPIHCRRLGNARFHIHVYDPLPPASAEADINAKALDLTRQINDYFEAWIRETPEQWICLKRRWPKAHKL